MPLHLLSRARTVRVVIVYKIKAFRQSMHARLQNQPAAHMSCIATPKERRAVRCALLRLETLGPPSMAWMYDSSRSTRTELRAYTLWLALVRAWPCHGCKTLGRTRHGAPS
jgi:hypothetical protein